MRAIVWAHPRSRSTAFERTFIERDDFVVLHEPLSKFMYFGADIDDLLSAMLDETEFLESPLLADVRHAPARPRFGIVKDFPYHALAHLTEGFLGAFRHIFLVRDPASTIRSFEAIHPKFQDNESGYVEMLALAKRLRHELGHDILIVDAGEFAAQPEAVLRRCCAFLGIRFAEKMLAWSPRTEIPAWGLWSRFHEKVLLSTTVESGAAISSAAPLPAKRKALVRALEPVYLEILGLGDCSLV